MRRISLSSDRTCCVVIALLFISTNVFAGVTGTQGNQNYSRSATMKTSGSHDTVRGYYGTDSAWGNYNYVNNPPAWRQSPNPWNQRIYSESAPTKTSGNHGIVRGYFGTQRTMENHTYVNFPPAWRE